MIHNHLMRSLVGSSGGQTTPTIDDYSILYTTSDGSLLQPTSVAANPVKSNVYINGVGKMTFAGRLTEIQGGLCNGNTLLTSVTLPDCCVALGDRAFSNCTALTKINLDKVTTLGLNCFISCAKCANYGSTSSLTTLGTGAFAQCGITAIDLSNVTSLGTSCFLRATALKTITGTIKCDIPTMCFRYCTALTGQISIRITAGMLSLDRNYCSSIGTEAFNYSTRISSIKLVEGGAIATTKSAITLSDTKTFAGSYYIYVPSGYLSVYQSATNWTYYKSRMKSY